MVRTRLMLLATACTLLLAVLALGSPTGTGRTFGPAPWRAGPPVARIEPPSAGFKMQFDLRRFPFDTLKLHVVMEPFLNPGRC